MFFCSGFCGLLYQIVWVRLAFASFGVNTPVLSVVISVFMLGLALGSWFAGILVSRIARKYQLSPIYLYALIEFLIGVGAFAVPFLFNASSTSLLKLGEMDSWSYLLASAVCIVVSILPWCICMGATFPFMMAYVKETSQAHTTSFSFLYLANVLGALTGTFITVIALIELFGFTGTLTVGAVLNFIVANLGLGLGKQAPPPQIIPKAAKKPETAPETQPLWRPETYFMVIILFLTGFLSMAMEVIWTRAFTTILQTQVYSFGAILFTYLLATWLGSMVYRKGLAVGKSFTNQILLAFLAVSSFFPVVLSDPRLNKSIPGVLLTILPFCAILGYLTPKLVDDLSGGNPKSAGKAYAVNVIGCILGPLLASYILLPWLGAKMALVVLAAPFIILGLTYLKSITFPRLGLQALAIVLMIISIGYSESYETIQKGVTRRDYVATVISYESGMSRGLLVNGVGITNLTPVTKYMAHLPLCLMNHKPEKALVICFGMGTTFRSLLSWNISTTAVELVPSVRDAFGYYCDDAEALLKRPNAKIVIDDGRRYLKRTEEQYDLITIDPPPPPETAGSSLLHSKEFLETVKSRLKKGGILQFWYLGSDVATNDAFARAICMTFPYIKIFAAPPPGPYGHYFVASMEPINVLPVNEMLAKMPPTAKADMMEWAPAGMSIENYAASVFKDGDYYNMPNPNKRIFLTDDTPFNEYYIMRHTFPHFTRWWGVGDNG